MQTSGVAVLAPLCVIKKVEIHTYEPKVEIFPCHSFEENAEK